MAIEGLELKRYITHAAREAGKAERVAGQCSNCKREVPEGNFCDQCGFTFLTEEAITALEAEVRAVEASGSES